MEHSTMAKKDWTRTTLAIGMALMTLGAGIGIWSTQGQHPLVFEHQPSTERGEGWKDMVIITMTEIGHKRGTIFIGANEAFVSGDLLDAMMAQGHEEYDRFTDAAQPTATHTVQERASRMEAYAQGFHQRQGSNMTRVSESAWIVLALIGVLVSASAASTLRERRKRAREAQGRIQSTG